MVIIEAPDIPTELPLLRRLLLRRFRLTLFSDSLFIEGLHLPLKGTKDFTPFWIPTRAMSPHFKLIIPVKSTGSDSSNSQYSSKVYARPGIFRVTSTSWKIS